MTIKDLYYNEYATQFELSKEELDEYTKSIYNQAVNDFEMKIKICFATLGCCILDDIIKIKKQLEMEKRWKDD